MQWWSDFQEWLSTAEGSQAVFVGIVILLSLIVGALLASWIAAASMRRMHTRRDNENKNSAIAALIDSATEACVWNSLTPQEQVLSNRAVGLADIQMRLLPIRGAAIAANWAAHQLAEMKRDSATFGYQLEPAIIELRDRLVDWSVRPAKARRNFESDLEDWQRAANDTERRLLAEQEAWVAEQHHENHSVPEAGPAPSFTPQVSFAAPAPGADRPVAHVRTQQLLDDVNALEQRRLLVNGNSDESKVASSGSSAENGKERSVSSS